MPSVSPSTRLRRKPWALAQGGMRVPTEALAKVGHATAGSAVASEDALAFRPGSFTVVERTSPAKGESHLYECTVLLSPGTSPEQVKETVKEISVEAEGLGGEVRETDLWGRRGLAYNIAGNTEALFVVLSLTLPPSAVQELSRSISIMKLVLRHLLVKTEPGVPFIRYSERFEMWKKEREQRERDREKEQEEKLKQQILKKVAMPKAPARRETMREVPAEMPKASIDAQLEEIISDENLHL